MTDGADLSQNIKDNASNPKRARNDSGEFEQHSLRDQIAVDNYLEGKKAVKRKNSGLKISKLSHSGS